MTAVSNDSNVLRDYGIDRVDGNSVNVSDATQLENNFITLMVAQIQNQDPTQPIDSTEFLNQYATLSQVKSMENMTSLSKSNLVLMDNLQTLTAAGLVGQEVTVTAGSVELSSKPVNGAIQLAHAAGSVQVTLTSASGLKKTVELGAQAPGRVAISLDPRVLDLLEGEYRIDITTDAGEFPAFEVSGKVNHVRVSPEGPVLDVDGAGAIPFYQITEFGQAPLAGLL